MARVADDDEKTARNAALALGKLGVERVPAADVERALVARWPSAPPALRRALAEALGKVGGADALALLDGGSDVPGDPADAELRRLVDEARVKIRRTLGRARRGRHRRGRRPDGAAAVARPLPPRPDELLAEELAADRPRSSTRPPSR